MYYLLVQLIFLILVQKCPYDIYICIFHITHACTKLRFQFNLHTLSAWSNGWCQGGWLCRVDMGWRCIKRATALRTDRLTPVDDPCSFFPVSSMLHARQIQGGGEQVPKHKVQPPETEKLFSRILSLLAAVLRGAGDSLESNQTTTYVSPIWDHSGLWLKSKDPNTISNKYVQMSQHVPTILSKTQC